MTLSILSMHLVQSTFGAITRYDVAQEARNGPGFTAHKEQGYVLQPLESLSLDDTDSLIKVN